MVDWSASNLDLDVSRYLTCRKLSHSSAYYSTETALKTQTSKRLCLLKWTLCEHQKHHNIRLNCITNTHTDTHAYTYNDTYTQTHDTPTHTTRNTNTTHEIYKTSWYTHTYMHTRKITHIYIIDQDMRYTIIMRHYCWILYSINRKSLLVGFACLTATTTTTRIHHWDEDGGQHHHL
jgi:hypothetical protein